MPERWDPPVFDQELILKYDQPGPRYTSYPPAPYFHEGFGAAAYEEEIRRTNAAGTRRPLSLYFHLPFCKSVCYFCGCNVHFTKNVALSDVYVDHVLKEMDALSPLIRKERKVEQVHWGGGTPTFMPAATLRRLFDGTSRRFTLDARAEIGVEIDPREVTEDHLQMLAECGFNRISMGIQDFDPAVQKAVHRLQSEELTRRVFDRCRELRFESINVDLIYGLPYQTAETFQRTVEKIVEIGPDRLALFNFAYLPDLIGHQRAIPAAALPSPVEKLRILQMVVERLTAAGYVFIGMDHFARPEDELTAALKDRTLYRNFQGYTTKAGCDLYGLGATSISQVGRCYAQNLKDLEPYQEAVERSGLAVFRGCRLSDDDVLRRDVITRLMCHFVVHKAEIEAEHGIVFDEVFGEALESLRPMERDGLLSLRPDRLEILPLGRLLVRNIAMAFDAYLKKPGGAKRFSRTV
ncbi:MAG: oxygen-independent coproporphyrinogen III oxidase [Planctomycetes bacterium]|nr:oxygen-independent coproporphyrinogen III oxidase [Planctomycetota bacterium]